MANILVLRKTLACAAEIPKTSHQAILRGYQKGDGLAWLRLQSAALPGSQAGRDWTERDFAREFLRQPWWSPERMLFATGESDRIIGTITLAQRGPADQSAATIHWLLVEPGYQRRRVATLLVARLESMCWELGWRSISLETLSNWEPAVAFYLARGYSIAP